MKRKYLIPGIIMSLIIFTFLSCSKSNNYATPPSGGGGNGNGDGGSSTIEIYNMAFPASTTVKKGTIVKWHNQDGYAHTVTSNDGTSFNSGNLAAGATFSYTANTVGTFNYHCNIHSNMAGSLIVTQ